MTPMDLGREIDEALGLLSGPLAPDEIKVGWTNALRQNWYHVLSTLKSKLDSGASITDYQYMVRALGMDALDRGALVRKIARIGNLLVDVDRSNASN